MSVENKASMCCGGLGFLNKPLQTVIYLLFSSSLFVSGIAMATEQPNYEILAQIEDFELRRYDPKIVAQTWAAGSQESAGRKGFQILADYIFGNNIAPSGESSKISMTAPVVMQPQENSDESKKIAMTAPVTMQKINDKWLVQFVMPSVYTMETLPKPKNSNIEIIKLPAKTYAVIKFSGLAGSEKVEAKTQKLQRWMQSQSLTASDLPELARYNPPWTLPFMRRNEVMIHY